MLPIWKEIEDWIAAARVTHIMYHNNLGVMGNYYGGMLDIYSNFTLHCAVLGGHIEVIEVDELSCIRQQVTAKQIQDKLKVFEEAFDVQPDCSAFELARAARTSAPHHR